MKAIPDHAFDSQLKFTLLKNHCYHLRVFCRGGGVRRWAQRGRLVGVFEFLGGMKVDKWIMSLPLNYDQSPHDLWDRSHHVDLISLNITGLSQRPARELLIGQYFDLYHWSSLGLVFFFYQNGTLKVWSRDEQGIEDFFSCHVEHFKNSVGIAGR